MDTSKTTTTAEEYWAGRRAFYDRTLAAESPLVPAVALVRLTTLGEHPVGIDQLAAYLGRSVADTTAQLDHLDGHWVRRDGDQLTLDLSQHVDLLRRRIRIKERDFPVSGCAPDVLAFAAVIDRPLQFEETCPATGTTIRVDLTPDEVVAVDPPEAVIAYPVVATDFDTINAMPLLQIDAEICSQGPMFASAAAARGWIANHPGGHVFSPREAYAHERVFARQLLGLPTGPISDSPPSSSPGPGRPAGGPTQL